MDPESNNRFERLTSGKDTWSASCLETGTAGAAGGPGKSDRETATAPRPDPTQLISARAGSFIDARRGQAIEQPRTPARPVALPGLA